MINVLLTRKYWSWASLQTMIGIKFRMNNFLNEEIFIFKNKLNLGRRFLTFFYISGSFTSSYRVDFNKYFSSSYTHVPRTRVKVLEYNMHWGRQQVNIILQCRLRSLPRHVYFVWLFSMYHFLLLWNMSLFIFCCSMLRLLTWVCR